MPKLRSFVVVSYIDHTHAVAAMVAAKSNFYRGVRAHAHDFNHVKGNTVFFMSTKESNKDCKIREFLLNQEGSLPNVCRIEIE